MKKTKLAAFALFIMTSVTLLTGCVRYKAELEVTKKGTVNFSMLYAVNSSLLNEQLFGDSVNVLDDAQIAEYKQNGFDVADYNEDGYQGLILSKNDIDLIAERKNEDASSAKTIDEQIKFEKNSNGHYEIRIQMNDLVGDQNSAASNLDEEGFSSTMVVEAIQQAGGYMDLSVKLPCAPLSSNATKTDGQTLTWDLLSFQEDSIFIEFGTDFWMTILLARYWWVPAAAIVLILLMIVVIVAVKAKKKRAFMPTM